MENELPIVYIARHGETAWSLSGQHTGLTDLPLTEFGEQNARKLGQRLKGLFLAKVLTSPLQRARRTCELAGYGVVAEIDSDLAEWDYGEYEGRRGVDIRAERPDWNLFREEAKRRSRSVPGRTELLVECGRFPETYCFSQAVISSGYWRLGGLGSNQRQTADVSC